MISKQEVEHIAKLARLELTEKEIEKLQKDMSAVLDYFDLLKKAPKVETETRFLGLDSLRKDEAEFNKNVKKEEYIKVKSVFDGLN